MTYLEREALIEEFMNDIHCLGLGGMKGTPRPLEINLFDVVDRIREYPAADVAPVKHAKWVHTDMAATWTAKDECGNCHYHTKERLDLSIFMYCPMCGCDMEVED